MDFRHAFFTVWLGKGPRSDDDIGRKCTTPTLRFAERASERFEAIPCASDKLSGLNSPRCSTPASKSGPRTRDLRTMSIAFLMAEGETNV